MAAEIGQFLRYLDSLVLFFFLFQVSSACGNRHPSDLSIGDEAKRPKPRTIKSHVFRARVVSAYLWQLVIAIIRWGQVDLIMESPQESLTPCCRSEDLLKSEKDRYSRHGGFRMSNIQQRTAIGVIWSRMGQSSPPSNNCLHRGGVGSERSNRV